MAQFTFRIAPLSRRAKRLIILAAIVALGVWIGFFDSHSIAKRVRWNREIAQVQAENEMLVRQTQEMEARLEEAESNEVIEQIAREQYGMRKPGERVYRVKRKEQAE